MYVQKRISRGVGSGAAYLLWPDDRHRFRWRQNGAGNRCKFRNGLLSGRSNGLMPHAAAKPLPSHIMTAVPAAHIRRVTV